MRIFSFSIKKGVFYFCFFLFLIVALYPRGVFLKYVEWKSKRYFKEVFGARFTFDGIELSQGKIIVKNGEVFRRNHFNAFFQKALLSPSFDWKKMTLSGGLSVEGLQIVHEKKEPFCLRPAPTFRRRFLKVDLLANIHEGELYLYDHLGESPFFQHMTFNFSERLNEESISGEISFKWGSETPEFTTRFSNSQDGVLSLSADFQNHSLSSLIGLAYYFFRSQLPSFIGQWDIGQGLVDGGLALSFCNGNPVTIQGDLSIEGLRGKNAQVGLLGEIDFLKADFDLDLSSRYRIRSWDGEFALLGGRLTLQEETIWQGICELSDLNSTICVKSGRIEHSSLNGKFMGMEGEMHLDWLSPEALIQMKFASSSKELIPLVSLPFQKGFEEAFSNDRFALNALVKRCGKGMELAGTLTVIEDKEESHELKFGCHFGADSESEIDALPESIPITLTQSMHAFLQNVEEQFCLSKKRIGWFQGSGFPIQKFLSPFLFQHINMDGFGSLDFEGSFDERYIIVFYKGVELQIESPSFSVYAEKFEKDSSSEMAAVHYIDLLTRKHMGFLPLQHARYLQKKQNFTFLDADATIHFENENIRIKEIATTWQDLRLQGEVDITIKALDDVDLEIRGSGVEGRVEDARLFLSHFENERTKKTLSRFCSLPMTGDISGSLCFKYHFTPLATLLDGKISGEMFCALDYNFFKLNDFQTSFDYSYNEKSLKFFNGEGMCILRDLPSCRLSLPSLCFHSTKELNTSLLCTLWKDETKLIQLEGHTESIGSDRALHFSGQALSNQEISIEGIQEMQKISIPKVAIGDWSGEISVNWDAEICHIEKIALNHPQKGFLDFQGEFDRAENRLDGEIDGFSITLNEMLSRFDAIGKVSGKGTLQWDPQEGVHILAKTAFKDIKFAGIPIDERENVVCTYSPEKGLTIEELEATFLDHKWELKNFSLNYNPCALNIWTQCYYRGDYYWLHLGADIPTLSHGTIALSEWELPQEHEALTATWERGDSWHIHAVSGSFSGLDVALQALPVSTSSDPIHLTGKVGLDPLRIAPLLADRHKKTLSSLALEGGYALEGDFFIPKQNPSEFFFTGNMMGNEIVLGGIELNNLSSSLSFQKGAFDFRNVVIEDWAGKGAVDHATLTQNGEEWVFSSGTIQVNDFRLSRLKSRWVKKEKRERPLVRSFYVRKCHINGLNGILSDKSTFTGNGELSFTNLPKRTLLTNLLFLPTEITARIGLDLTSLIPVRGNIVYEIHDGKIFFKEFQEMYSDGKRSRFYLAEGHSAYLDLNGNLNLKIKMKQYNLLMKLAELFTITVNGTLKEPKYIFTDVADNS